MASLRVIVLAVLVLVAVFHTATSLVCIQCGTSMPLGCEVGTYINQTCTQSSPVCIRALDHEDKVFYAGCGTSDTCKAYATCDSCSDGDRCNSPSSVVLPSFLVFAVASAFIAKHFF